MLTGENKFRKVKEIHQNVSELIDEIFPFFPRPLVEFLNKFFPLSRNILWKYFICNHFNVQFIYF